MFEVMGGWDQEIECRLRCKGGASVVCRGKPKTELCGLGVSQACGAGSMGTVGDGVYVVVKVVGMYSCRGACRQTQIINK
jgi:hypothetical protein